MFQSPEGEYFKGKSKVMKFMLNNNYSSEDIIALREFFKIDGWETHEELPEDWMWCQPGRNKVLRLLSPSGNMFKSKTTAVNFIIESGGEKSDTDKIRNFKYFNQRWPQVKLDSEETS